MKRIALITAIAMGISAPAFADVNLGVTSPAEIADVHGADTNFMASVNLGKVSPAEIDGNDFDRSDDVISTQSIETLRLLGLTSPAEIAAAQR